MNKILEELENEINWRTEEISIIKLLPYQIKFTAKQKTLILRSSVVTLYALWEGYVVAALSIYLERINQKQLTIEQIHPNILTYDMENKLKIGFSRDEFKKKISHVENILQYCSNPIIINIQINTKSNVNYSILCNLMYSLNLSPISHALEKKLDKLLKFRNDIAHGEYQIPVTSDNIVEFSETINESMGDMLLSIIDGYKTEKYRK